MSAQPPYYGQQQQPPEGYNTLPPGGAPPSGYGPSNQGTPYQYPPPGHAPPGSQPPYYGYPSGGQPGQYPAQQQYPSNAPYGQQQQLPPPPPQGAPYGQQQQQQQQQQQPLPPNSQYINPYGQPPAGYGPPPPQGYPPQAQQWQQPLPPQGAPGYSVPPTPASPGYDTAQKTWAQPVNTSADLETLRRAMKGMGCDERALIQVLTSPQYTNPWAMQQLVQDYNSRFIRSLFDDIKSETRGELETALLALVRGPLAQDVFLLDKSLNRMGTDEDTLLDVLLGRSNADLRAIAAEYRRTTQRDLLADIKSDVDEALYRLCSMLLAGQRAEEAAPVLPHEIDAKAAEVQRATEGMIGANAIAVAHVFASSSAAQLAAVARAYQRNYRRALDDVIEREFRGDLENALLRMLADARDRPAADAMRLREALIKRKDKLFINRVVSLYWNYPRLAAAKDAYRRKYGTALDRDVKAILKGDHEAVLLALLKDR